jgi:hypothetical protein
VDNETCFLRKYHCESREKGKLHYIVKLASFAILKLVLILASLATKFLFASLATKFVCKTRKNRVLLRNLSARHARSESC